MILKRPAMAEILEQYSETTDRAKDTVSSFESLWVLFTKLMNNANTGKIFCILDGLDECDDDSVRLLVSRLRQDYFRKDSSSAKQAFKLLVASRPLQGLNGCINIQLDRDKGDKKARDVERFISSRVQELSSLEGFNGDTRHVVENLLYKRAGGTFSWVGFVMHELLQKTTCIEV